MIGKLTGILAERNPPQVVVDCNGVGYEVDVPMSTFYNLPHTGERISLLTHFVVREDAQIAIEQDRRVGHPADDRPCGIELVHPCAAPRRATPPPPWTSAA